MTLHVYYRYVMMCRLRYSNRCAENNRSRGRSAGALQRGGASTAAVRPGGSAVRRLRVAESESPEAQRKREAVWVFFRVARPRTTEAVHTVV